jgi:hypothetical protein
MKTLQKAGGFAALYQAAAYLTGMVFFMGIINYPAITQPVEMVASLVEHHSGWYIMTLLTYVVFGFALVVLALALNDRLKAGSPAVMQVSTALGLIWAGLLIGSGMIFNVGMESVITLYAKDAAQAATIWQSIDAVHTGLSGNGEVIGGLWTLLVSWAALRSGSLHKGLNILGLFTGGIGLLSVIPALEVLMSLFGIVQLIWFTWLGILLVREARSQVMYRRVLNTELPL